MDEQKQIENVNNLIWDFFNIVNDIFKGTSGS